MDDPHIDYADSGNSGVRKIPTGIPSGGINITVVGGNFNYIQDPKMYVVYQVREFLHNFDIFSKNTIFGSPLLKNYMVYCFYLDLTNLSGSRTLCEICRSLKCI